MHSRIFQLSLSPLKEEEFIGEEAFYDNSSFVGPIADYVSDDTNRKEDIEWLLEVIGRYGVQYNAEEESIVFLEGFKRNYFRKKFEEFKKLAEKMDPDKFIKSIEVYELEQLITDRFGFYVFINEENLTLDNFVRYVLQEGEKYYFGATLDYHF